MDIGLRPEQPYVSGERGPFPGGESSCDRPGRSHRHPDHSGGRGQLPGKSDVAKDGRTMKKKPATQGKPAKKSVQEVSAGGIVQRDGELLLVKVKNLKGQVVWTFPKGHIEKGETLEQTAEREVLEETGWRCQVS